MPSAPVFNLVEEYEDDSETTSDGGDYLEVLATLAEDADAELAPVGTHLGSQPQPGSMASKGHLNLSKLSFGAELDDEAATPNPSLGSKPGASPSGSNSFAFASGTGSLSFRNTSSTPFSFTGGGTPASTTAPPKVPGLGSALQGKMGNPSSSSSGFTGGYDYSTPKPAAVGGLSTAPSAATTSVSKLSSVPPDESASASRSLPPWYQMFASVGAAKPPADSLPGASTSVSGHSCFS